MEHGNLSVRPLQHSDIPLLSEYWFGADPAFLVGMGVDLAKMPTPEEWTSMLEEQLGSALREKKSYCIIWEVNGVPSGHCNVNRIVYGDEASMHLHLWHSPTRSKGCGTQLVKLSLPSFFNDLELCKIYCEPYAFNVAPNRTLNRVGFRFVKQYTTIPGFINFEQEVKRWELTREEYQVVSGAVSGAVSGGNT